MARFFDAHRALPEDAMIAVRDRGYGSAFSEIPAEKISRETARAAGDAAFEANPAGTASFTDTALVADRFRVAAMRRPLAA